MTPFVVGNINVFILVQHHPDMQPDDRLHLFQRALVAGFYDLEIGHEFVGYLETDGLEDLRLGLDMVIQAGGLYPHMFSEITHRSRPKALFPKELGRFFDDHLFFGAVPSTLNFSHEYIVVGKYNKN